MFKGYRTILVAVFFTILGVLEATDLTPFLPIEWKPYAPIVIPIVFGLLRVVTSTPIGIKEDA